MALIQSTKPTNTNLPQPNTDVQAAQTTAASYQADQRQVDPKSTVQGQMTSLLDKGGDYMKRAETKGLQIANKRGLLNTDMAISAAHGAAMDAAMPIATQDAQTYNTQSLTNQASNNQANQFNAATQTQTDLANQSATNRASEFNSSMDLDKWNTEKELESREFLTRLEQSGKMEQMSAEASANLKGEYVKTWDKMRQDSIIAIQEIQNNPNIKDAALKESAIQQQIDLLAASKTAMDTIYESLPQWSQDWAQFTEV